MIDIDYIVTKMGYGAVQTADKPGWTVTTPEGRRVYREHASTADEAIVSVALGPQLVAMLNRL